MYLNAARFIIRFVSSVKSAFPFANKSKVTTGDERVRKSISLFGIQSTFKKVVFGVHNYTLDLIEY